MEKKKVYVETTVVSDATALPTNDLVLMGRQITTIEWWNTAITNAQKIPMTKRICAECGYVCPEICTPYQLQQDGGAE